MLEVGSGNGTAEEVPLVNDVRYSDFDNTNYEVSIEENNHYQPVRTTVDDDAVLGQTRSKIVNNDNFQSPNDKEPLLNCAITEQLPNESKVQAEEMADSGNESNSRIWHLAYYQGWFDLSTNLAVSRLTQALWPGQNDAFIFDRTHNKPDLYCPFWLIVTLAFLVAAMSNVSKWMQSSSGKLEQWESDLDKLVSAWFILVSFSLAAPLVFYIVFKYTGNPKNFLEILSVFGYSLTIYVPSAILMIPPSPAWQWIVVLLACSISTEFIVSNLWMRSPHGWATINWQGRFAWACLLLMVFVHMSLALVIKLCFYTL